MDGQTGVDVELTQLPVGQLTISIVEDSRMNRLGGLKCAIKVRSLAILPSLLSNSETFDALDKEVIKSLEYFQTYLLRGLIALSKSCPIPVLKYESNLLQMKYRLDKRVLNFAKHIYCQSEDLSLAKQIMSEQIKNGWPGLCKQAQLISDELNIEGLFDHDVDKV